MSPRWYRILRIGSVVAFALLASVLVALRVFMPREPPKPDERPSPPLVSHGCRGVPLVVSHERSSGAPRRAYVRATIDHQDVAMLLDSGSAKGYVRVELDAGVSAQRVLRRVRMGGIVREMPTRPGLDDQDPWDFEERGKLPIAGKLGAEELLAGTTELDLRSGCLTRHPAGFTVEEATRWAVVPFSVVNGVIVTRVAFDGAARAVLFDTGVGNSILVTEEFRPFVHHEVTYDVRGHAVDLYLRAGTVRWGNGATESAWLERTPRFDTFDDMKLGDVHAMVGITAMGLRKIIVDPARKALLVEPLR
jgi:hypothetical protein